MHKPAQTEEAKKNPRENSCGMCEYRSDEFGHTIASSLSQFLLDDDPTILAARAQVFIHAT
jgi:hypothetical protein